MGQETENIRRLDAAYSLDSSIGKLDIPYTLLLYGSVARGVANLSSDIDMLAVFRNEDLPALVNIYKYLPFHSHSVKNIEHILISDFDDLHGRKIDFLRIIGDSNGVVIELQIFPEESIRKATSIFGGDLISGKRSLLEEDNFAGQNSEILEQTYRGTVFAFQKSPRLTETGRVDVFELGIKKYRGEWTRGMTAKKLLFAKVLRDALGLQDYLDRRVFHSQINAMFFYSGYYVRDENDYIVGIRREALCADNFLDFSSFIRNDSKLNPIKFNEEERALFEAKYQRAIDGLVIANRWKIYD